MGMDAVVLNWGQSDLEVHLRLKGGWGMDNLTSACGWIANGLHWRTASASTFVIHTGRGFSDNLDAVLAGEVDMAFITPIVAAAMALQGRGPYTAPHPNLRALAALPHRDRLVLAVDPAVAERYGLHTFADFVTKCPPLRIATGLNDGINIVGYSVEKVLNAHGLAWEDLERWGGRWLVAETPHPALNMLARGEADAVFNEAIMVWQRFIGPRPLRYLPIAQAVLDTLHQDYGYLAATIEPGDLPGVEQPVLTLDFSQWLLVARADLPAEVARLAAQVIVEDRASFESRYKHYPIKQSALSYPIHPQDLARTAPIPLHPGAAQYYHAADLAGPEV